MTHLTLLSSLKPMRCRPLQSLCQGTALLALLASASGCQLLYDSKLADSQRDCEKLVMQTDVTDCRRRLQAQQDAFRRSQEDKTRADRAAPAASR